jgi:hypothetical protein
VTNIIVKFIALLLSVIFFSVCAHASSREYKLFEQGYEYYFSYQPEKAVETFKIFLNEFPNSFAKDAAMFWLGKSLKQTDSPKEAEKVFSDIKHQFPDSPFIPYVNKELMSKFSEGFTKKGTEINNPIKETGIPERDLRDEYTYNSEKNLENDRKIGNKLTSSLAIDLSKVTEERNKLQILLEETNKKTEELRVLLDSLEKKEFELKGLLVKLEEQQKNLKKTSRNLTLLRDERGKFGSEIKTQGKEKMQAEILHTLEIVAVDTTWIFATIDEKESKDMILRPGDRIKLFAKKGISLKIGNAGGVKLIFDGKEIGSLGEKGKVKILKLPALS